MYHKIHDTTSSTFLSLYTIHFATVISTPSQTASHSDPLFSPRTDIDSQSSIISSDIINSLNLIPQPPAVEIPSQKEGPMTTKSRVYETISTTPYAGSLITMIQLSEMLCTHLRHRRPVSSPPLRIHSSHTCFFSRHVSTGIESTSDGITTHSGVETGR